MKEVPVRRELEAAVGEVVVPVAEEQISVGVARTEAYRVRVTKTVERDELVVEAPHAHEDVSVERVAVGLETDTPPTVRTEGDTTIIPVVEEIIVVQKRFLVREEIRITKTRVDETRPLPVTRQREHVEVERIEASSGVSETDQERRRRS